MITLAEILSSNAAKREAEQQAIETAEKHDLLLELADTTESLDVTIEVLEGMVEDLKTARTAISAIENSPTVSNDLLADLVLAGDEALDQVDNELVDMGNFIQSVWNDARNDYAAECACEGPMVFNFANGGPVSPDLIRRFLERAGETIIPRQAAE